MKRNKLISAPFFLVLAGIVVMFPGVDMTQSACAEQPGYIVSVQLENDLFGSTDRYFTHGFYWYVFTGSEARLVIRNIFLDGNTFKDSHCVDKKPLVGDIQAGVVFQYDRIRLSYTQIYRLKEFKGQKRPHNYGSLGVSYQF